MTELKHTEGRVIVKIDLDYKNHHRFADGTEIRLERGYNNFNLRESRPTNAIVISAENIPTGAEILIHHNSTHETNRIADYEPLSGDPAASSIKYFSIPIEECFAYIDTDGIVKPCDGYQFGLRVYKPYLGQIVGIEPELIPDVLFCYTGELRGLVVGTLKSCDYEMVFQGRDGVEQRVIRFRHYDNKDSEREEVQMIRNDLTQDVHFQKLIVGLTPTDAKKLIEYNNQKDPEILAYAD